MATTKNLAIKEEQEVESLPSTSWHNGSTSNGESSAIQDTNHEADELLALGISAYDQQEVENLSSTSWHNGSTSNGESSAIQDTNHEADELLALGISAYDQTELETEFIAQVNEQIKAQEDESRKIAAKKDLEHVNIEISTVKKRIRHIDKALEMAPKETDSSYTKEVKRFVISIKQEKENKLKQLKKMEARERMLLKQCEDGVTLESLEKFINEDDNVEMDTETKAHLEYMFGKKETDREKLIKTGQMTPFGTVVKKSITEKPKLKASNTEMTDFEKYLLDQSNFQSQKKKSLGKKTTPKKKTTPEKTRPLSRKKKVVKVDRKPVQVETVKVKVGDDSDWLPGESENEEESFTPTKVKRKKAESGRNSKKLKKGDWSDESETEVESSSFKTIDDGNQDAYFNRLRKYEKKKMKELKENEEDLDSDEEQFEEFEGGYRMIKQLWNKLYDFQKTGVRWLWELHLQNCGGILGDEMGLGKTIQMITFFVGLHYSNLKTQGDNFRGLGPTLIVCPTTLMHQWVMEFHIWWPPFRVAVLHESGSHVGTKEALVRNVHKDNGVIVTSYNAVVKHQDLLVPRTWHYVVLDEGHKIRNPDAQITLACKQLKTSHRILLSGSPVQNHLKELWSLFDFIFPGKLGTLPVFMQQFSVPIVQGGYSNATQVQVETSYRCALVLRDTINPYLLRRMKTDVKMSLDLPNKNEQVLFCRLSKEQLKCYKEYISSPEVRNILDGRLKVFMGLIALRKICNHPDLYSGGPEKMLVAKNMATDFNEDPTLKYGFHKRAGKMLVIEALLKSWKRQGHRVLLFSQSKQMLDILEKYVQDQEYTYMRMDGGTNIGSRQPAVNKFNKDSSIFVFLLTTRVGGLGVNLTGANRVVIYDPDWNPSTDVQARERAWRIGQSKHVTIYRLLTSGTIEEKIYHRQIFKQFLTNKILKDPKQRRFFKNNELHELFTLVEDGKEGTETGAIFAGTGSEISAKSIKNIPAEGRLSAEEAKKEKMKLLARKLSKMIADPTFKKNKSRAKNKKKSSKRRKQYVEGEAIENLTKQEVYNGSNEADVQQNSKQDDYVLKKLFGKSGVHSALRHDNIMNSADPDYMLVEGEAEKVAKAAVKALKLSRRQCAKPESGIPTWTGHNGYINSPKSKSKFGKRNTKLFGAETKEQPGTSTQNLDTKNKVESTNLFGGLGNGSLEETDQSSGSILEKLLKRSSEPLSSDDEGEEPSPKKIIPDSKNDELLCDIRNFVAFQANMDGQATTEELLQYFKDKLTPKDSALFKSMLQQICDFHRKFSKAGVWKLKPDFR